LLVSGITQFHAPSPTLLHLKPSTEQSPFENSQVMVSLRISPFSWNMEKVHYQVKKAQISSLVRKVGNINSLPPKYPIYFKNNEMSELEKHMG
jgi:hypothetical protein